MCSTIQLQCSCHLQCIYTMVPDTRAKESTFEVPLAPMLSSPTCFSTNSNFSSSKFLRDHIQVKGLYKPGADEGNLQCAPSEFAKASTTLICKHQATQAECSQLKVKNTTFPTAFLITCCPALLLLHSLSPSAIPMSKSPKSAQKFMLWNSWHKFSTHEQMCLKFKQVAQARRMLQPSTFWSCTCKQLSMHIFNSRLPLWWECKNRKTWWRIVSSCCNATILFCAFFNSL